EDRVEDALRQPPFGQHDLQLTLADGLGTHRLGQHRDAHALPGQRHQHREIETGHPRLEVDPLDLAVGAVQLPALAGLVLAHRHGDVFGQLFRVRGAAHLAQVVRAGHQQLLDLAEAAHHQAAIVVEPGAYAQSDVDAFVDNVDPPVAHLQLHAHLRIPGEEL